VRQLIEQRLAAGQAQTEPKPHLLANVIGPVSRELLAMIEAPTRQAAVLIALIERNAGLTVLFTERSPDLTHHPGQISFPGGRLDHPDETAVAAALREAQEEVGLDRRSVSVAGCLDEHVTGTGFRVTPVIGFVPDDFVPVPDPIEVQTVFEVPLEFLLDPANVHETVRERFGTRFRSFEYRYAGHQIWGATAAMLITFRGLING
jgi:8-oxo-dGTP pyrophosphatase MutT (NUDIX family)